MHNGGGELVLISGGGDDMAVRLTVCGIVALLALPPVIVVFIHGAFITLLTAVADVLRVVSRAGVGCVARLTLVGTVAH